MRRHLTLDDRGLAVEIDADEVIRQLDPGMFDFWPEDDISP